VYSNSLSYFTALKAASPKSTFVQLANMPNVQWPGSVNPVGCLELHQGSINLCDRAPVDQSSLNAQVALADAGAGVATIDVLPWVCDATCPPVINGMIPYSRDGLHLNTVYSASLVGVLWTSLAAVAHSGILAPN
jgi:hypothetical protein